MLTTMATALLNAIPGESPETRLAAFAERLGAVYEGSCWRMSPAVRETLRDAAVALALESPEPVDDATDPGWEAVVLEAEARRQARTVERVTARFSRSCRGAGRQALFDGQGAMLAQLVAADLPGWRRGQRTPLKTEASNREVDILPAVRRVLEQQRLIAGGRALVFPNQLGGYIHVGNLRQRVWYPALKKAGLKRRDLYNTRHTFATHALASAEDPGWVQKMLGHTTLMMLMTRYYRYVPNLTRRDATRPAIGAAAVSEVCPYFVRRAFRLSVRAA